MVSGLVKSSQTQVTHLLQRSVVAEGVLQLVPGAIVAELTDVHLTVEWHWFATGSHDAAGASAAGAAAAVDDGDGLDGEM